MSWESFINNETILHRQAAASFPQRLVKIFQETGKKAINKLCVTHPSPIEYSEYDCQSENLSKLNYMPEFLNLLLVIFED